MNKQTEALKMAIEALKDADKGYAVIGEYDELIQACKEALEQPRNFCERCGKPASKDQYHIHTCTPPQALEQPAPLWQGLSDDEIEEIVDCPVDVLYSGDYEIYRAIEQALKEKNYEIHGQ